MLQRKLPQGGSAVPGRRFRLVIEDRELAHDRALSDDGALPFDVRVCAGPRSEAEACPLVTDGRCPLGPCDAVVTALEGPWARSVCAAWREDGVPLVVAADASSTGRARLDRAVAAALAVVVPAGPPVGSR
jgi:hypothetical protein